MFVCSKSLSRGLWIEEEKMTALIFWHHEVSQNPPSSIPTGPMSISLPVSNCLEGLETIAAMPDIFRRISKFAENL